jgi:hypothetical protein
VLRQRARDRNAASKAGCVQGRERRVDKIAIDRSVDFDRK